MADDRPNRPVRDDFPILSQGSDGARLVYLDSGASAQKPAAVIQAISRFYETGYANIHRGVYRLSAEATESYEAGRARVARFLHAKDPREIVFVRGATEAINLIADSWGRRLKPGDEILITELEHHANIVPWQMLRDRLGIILRVAPVDVESGQLDLAALKASLSPRTRLVACTHVANATGAVLPLAPIIAAAHAVGALVLVDGCQAAPHRAVDVQALGCDFYVCSGHKIYGPTGIGFLWGRLEILNSMPPYQTGGDMITSVTLERSEFQDAPHRFEAGTPDIAGVVGLSAALDYLERLGWHWITSHEQELLDYGRERLASLPGVHLVPAGCEQASIISFTVDDIHPHDLGSILDEHQVAIRTGAHCAQPLLEKLGLHATARISFGVYNEPGDIDALVSAILAAQRMFKL